MTNANETKMITRGKQPFRIEAALIVAANWRIRRRLPRITLLALKLGFISDEVRIESRLAGVVFYTRLRAAHARRNRRG